MLDGTAPKASEQKVALIAWIAVVMLMVFGMLSSMDRAIIALLVDPIKRDLQIDDVQFSLLQGLAFVLFYALASIPMGWLGDRTSHRWVIYGGVTLWSAATILCGFANTFALLFLARVFVGIGEATLSPSSYALISTLFPQRRMALAAGILACGGAVGAGVAFAAGGVIVEWAKTAPPILGLTDWHLVFLVAGIPGVLLAPLVFLIPEASHKIHADALDAIQDKGYLHWLKANASYVGPLFFGSGCVAVMAYAVTAWAPAYLSRHFGVSVESIGGTLGIAMGVGGVIGFIGGGWLVDWMHAHGVRDAHFRYILCNAALMSVVGVLSFTVAGTANMVILLIGVQSALFPTTGQMISHLRMTTPVQYRARTTALMMLIVMLLGMVFGPTTVAVVSENILGGPQHVGLGIAVTFAIFGPLAFLSYAVGLRPARRALANAIALSV